MTINITTLRRAGHSDQAVLDLLQLQQLGVIPGRIGVARLCELWSCHQSSASRRMSAVNRLGIVTVRSSWGAYTIDDEPPRPHQTPATPRPGSGGSVPVRSSVATPAAGGGGMTETATLTVSKIRDGDGQPTCRYWEHFCPFLLVSGFGSREHCHWLDGRGPHRPQLERRDLGRGTTIPHSQCPIWHGQEVAA